ncbi:cupin domain-containing protein [Moorella sulfitireducens (nom. illeg.)]|uniref:cupin domain-containing protein n=1 Tax=Neomoorella sulfitireducens TaxID=2972948 RepID=UPI0021AD4527|nr:cupin domain-containing protein [Moorella sulfitireducens]
MKVVKAGEGRVYDARKHFHMWGIKMVSPEVETRGVTVSMSHFLPNGGAEMSTSPLERAYYVLAGSITVRGHEAEYVLNEGDLVYIPPGEEREIEVNNNRPATILVVTAEVK